MPTNTYEELRDRCMLLSSQNGQMQADRKELREHNDWLQQELIAAEARYAALYERLKLAQQAKSAAAIGPFLLKCAGVCITVLFVAKVFVELS